MLCSAAEGLRSNLKGVPNGGGGSVAIILAIVVMKLDGNSDGELRGG